MMHLYRLLPAALLLLTHSGTAAAQVHRNDLRDLVDVCASLDIDLAIPLGGKPLVVGKLDLCLCISAIPEFLQTNLIAIAAVAIAGKPVVTGVITGLINDAAGKSHCTYPEHSVPACTDKSCGFSCTDGFSPSPASHPTTCVCKAPNTVCNGVCGHFPSCASGKPHSKRSKKDRLWEGSGTCWDRGQGWMACGVFGGAARAWECVNTKKDLESCGGCMLPLTPYTPTGTDCTALPGVADVECVSGSCVVQRCAKGYVPSWDGSECIHTPSSPQHHAVYAEWDGDDTPATRYGLEHIPLKA